MISPEQLKTIALRTDESGRYLQYLDGKRYFVQADTGESCSQIEKAHFSAWELGHRCTRDEVIYYLDARKAQGFNAVLMVLLPELE